MKNSSHDIYTVGHLIFAEVRNLELEYARAVKIGNSVWNCGNVAINPGVTIGYGFSNL